MLFSYRISENTVGKRLEVSGMEPFFFHFQNDSRSRDFQGFRKTEKHFNGWLLASIFRDGSCAACIKRCPVGSEGQAVYGEPLYCRPIRFFELV